MKIFVTGGSGMVGTSLVKKLEKLGHEVHAPSRRAFRVEIENDWRIRMEKFQPQLIIHLAAETNVDKCEKQVAHAFTVNALPMMFLGRYAPKDCRVIYMSTASVFGNKGRQYPEEDCSTYAPLSHYSSSKLLGEEYGRIELANNKFLQLIIIRAGWIFGGGSNDKKFIGKIYDKLKSNELIKVVNDRFGQPIYTEELSDFIAHIIERLGHPLHKPYYVFHASSFYHTSRYDMTIEMRNLINSSSKVLPVGNSFFNLPAERPVREFLGSHVTERITGFEFKDWKTSLKEYLSTLQNG